MPKGSLVAVGAGGKRSRPARVAVAGALAVLVGLASGCAVEGSPSTVAYVADDRISQDQLDSAVTAIQQTLDAEQQVSTSAVVNVMVHGLIADQIAEAHNITLTDAQRDQLLAGSNLAPLLGDPAAKSIAYDIADQQLVAKAVGTEAYLQGIQGADVTLNPRFGVLDPAQKTIIDGQSSSLSVPATTP